MLKKAYLEVVELNANDVITETSLCGSGYIPVIGPTGCEDPEVDE